MWFFALPKLKHWWLFVYCFVAMILAISMAVAQEPQNTPNSKGFWFQGRQVQAELRNEGVRSLIYVDKKLGQPVAPDYLRKLTSYLEKTLPPDSYSPAPGIVALEERLFGNLPQEKGRENRLQIVIAQPTAPEKATFQLTGRGSVIFLSGLPESEDQAAYLIAQALAHLLLSHAAGPEIWLRESLANASAFLSGVFSPQDPLNAYAKDTGSVSLLFPESIKPAPQALFGSYLLDSFPDSPDIATLMLAQIKGSGQQAVEKLYGGDGSPLSFDAVFSEFISYLFARDDGGNPWPRAWNHAQGFELPAIAANYSVEPSQELNGPLLPYSFIAVDLSEEIAPRSLVKVENLTANAGPGLSGSCAADASVLWKPIGKKRIALYAVGCAPRDAQDILQFRLKIVNQPSLMPMGAFRILP